MLSNVDDSWNQCGETVIKRTQIYDMCIVYVYVVIIVDFVLISYDINDITGCKYDNSSLSERLWKNYVTLIQVTSQSELSDTHVHILKGGWQ